VTLEATGSVAPHVGGPRLGRHGITVNAAAPGQIATPITDQADETRRAVRARVPLRRPREAREVAAVVPRCVTATPWW
jgi:NAD(P)-dependent dehydrogenase (short-subunit alcohol dehydrogenase family)